MVFDREGNYLKSWGDGLFANLHGGCLGPDNSIYCADVVYHTVTKYTIEGKLLFTLGTKGQASDTGFDFAPGMGITLDEAIAKIKQAGPPFNNPTNCFVAKSGNIYVADGYGNARIHVFSPEGNLLFSWGEPGSGNGQFKAPHGIWIDRHDKVWVVDRKNHRIQIYTLTGEYIDQWIGFDEPCDIAIDKDETVYIAELGCRISIFDKNGKLLARITNDEKDKENALLVGPHTLCVDDSGDLYVGEVAFARTKIDKGGRAIHKFTRVKQ